MGLSLDEFRSYLLNPQARQSLGIQLSDAEAQQVVADPQASQSWYGYWQSISQPAPPAPAPAPSPTPDGYIGAPAGGFAAAPPPAAVPAPQQPAPDASASDTPTAAHGAAPAAVAAPAAFAPTAPYEGANGAPYAGPGDAYAATAPYGMPGSDAPAKKKRTGLWVTLSIVGALLIAAIIVVVIAFTTARHWTKTDVAEKPETFHTEEYETGLYNVADDGVSPCTVNQDWTDCIGLMEAEYAGACADVELTGSATLLCTQHRTEIDRMRDLDQEGMYVSSLGSFGHLTKTAETATREVSNEDYEPAVTHEAVCYLEFIGECE
ncbi:hypothetical protein ACFY9N_07290 [Microbacterium sp. NPDC008134]|uniref:hypothetical protein n=1 Tax=Microbacterium sp. NPDC008134 TaxID=3364183 RepID=UPI0036F02FEA